MILSYYLFEFDEQRNYFLRSRQSYRVYFQIPAPVNYTQVLNKIIINLNQIILRNTQFIIKLIKIVGLTALFNCYRIFLIFEKTKSVTSVMIIEH